MCAFFSRQVRGLSCIRRSPFQTILPPSIRSFAHESLCSNEKPSPNNLTIALTPAEDSLFSFLEYIQRLYAPTTHLRVAGGWVRDKLRGAESDDIDIALDNVMGATFARFITKFQRDRKLPPSSVGLVKANSNKSKHLEVATIAIQGFTVDFVHLRAEAYSLNSRIPNVTFASPQDDANRRDLTINALFYNLHTREIEDFTGQGVLDLNQRLIRTPRDPARTFLDDPLRVLRALRFACDLQFTLDKTLETALLSQREIVHAMTRKVSRERIGIEVRKMLAGEDPARAFDFLRTFKLLDVVFGTPPCHSSEGSREALKYPPRPWTDLIQQRASHILKYLQQSRWALAKYKISNVESMAAILTPLFVTSVPKILCHEHGSLHCATFPSLPENKLIACSLDFLDMRETIVAALNINEIVEMLKEHVKWPKPAGKRVALIIEAIATYPEGSVDTNDVDHWIQQFMWMTQYYSVITPALTILIAAHSFGTESVEKKTALLQETMLQAYLDLANTYVTREDEVSADTVKPTRQLDGKTVQTRLGPGASQAIARALGVLHVYYKVHPNATLEDALAFLDRLAPRLRKSPV